MHSHRLCSIAKCCLNSAFTAGGGQETWSAFADLGAKLLARIELLRQLHPRHSLYQLYFTRRNTVNGLQESRRAREE